jgi:hypothetical protein
MALWFEEFEFGIYTGLLEIEIGYMISIIIMRLRVADPFTLRVKIRTGS